MSRVRVLAHLCFFLFASFAGAGEIKWIRPDVVHGTNRPEWGIAGGMSVGLWPTPGPRGLIRIYTPYLGQPNDRMINFIAVEPIVGENRGLSEIEKSKVDGLPGKQFMTADTIESKAGDPLARGVTWREGDVERLRLILHVEKFENGAEPIVQVTFRSDRPEEVELQTFAAAGSATMKYCVLTATMGNYARLRHLRLKDQTVEAADLFRDAKPDHWAFFPGRFWMSPAMPHDGNQVIAQMTGDLDASPDEAPPAWRYVGRPAVQTWLADDCPGLQVQVNGRSTFWGTKASIPGGVAFENFELLAPFRAGESSIFRVTPR